MMANFMPKRTTFAWNWMVIKFIINRRLGCILSHIFGGHGPLLRTGNLISQLYSLRIEYFLICVQVLEGVVPSLLVFRSVCICFNVLALIFHLSYASHEINSLKCHTCLPKCSSMACRTIFSPSNIQIYGELVFCRIFSSTVQVNSSLNELGEAQLQVIS